MAFIFCRAPVKRVVRGVIDFAQGTEEVTQTFSPSVDPAKSVVTLSNLTATQITVRADASISLMPAKVSYQIIEYN